MQYYRSFLTTLLPLIVTLFWPSLAHATDYYISPSGSDSNSGLRVDDPWQSFDRAWEDLYPGDTLFLLDGVYRQTLNPNKRNGTESAPITVRALNDGMAIIDGEGVRETVRLEFWGAGPIGSYYVIEGIVARNSSGSVFQIEFDHNVLRRVSGYDAYTDGNEHVFSISGEHTLIEDCVAAGSGRKMIVIFQGNHNLIRRCFAYWQSWDGREWGDDWPWGDNIQIYNASDNIIENSIAYGPAPVWALSIQANGEGAVSSRNQILGSIALNAGMKTNGTPMEWGNTRPQPTEHTQIRDFNWPSQRVGIMLLSAGTFDDNLVQDVVASGNAGLGFSTLFTGPSTRNNRIVRASIFNNGLDNPDHYGGKGVEVRSPEIDILNVSNTYVESSEDYTGDGAQIVNRYVDGQLTNQPLFPWPMEARIQRELNLSISAITAPVLTKSTPTPVPTTAPSSPTPVPPTSTVIPTRDVPESPTVTPTMTNTPTAIPAVATSTPTVEIMVPTVTPSPTPSLSSPTTTSTLPPTETPFPASPTSVTIVTPNLQPSATPSPTPTLELTHTPTVVSTDLPTPSGSLSRNQLEVYVPLILP